MLTATRSWSPAALSSEDIEERERAWNALYGEQVERIFRLACCLGVPPGDAEDVVQRVFVVVHRRRKELAGIDNLEGWLRGITVKVVADRRRWHRVRALKAALLRATVRSATERPATPEQSAASLQAQQLVQRVLGGMSPKLRDVLVLLDLEGCKPGEVAQVLGIPVNTVRSRARLARAEFSRRWQEQGMTP